MSTRGAAIQAGFRRARAGPPSELAASEQQLGHAQVERRGHLEVLLAGAHDDHLAAAALDQPRVVGRPRELLRGHLERPLERLAAEHLRRLHRPQLAAVERLAHRAAASTRLTVSVTGTAAIAASASASPASAAITASASEAVSSGRAASWTSTTASPRSARPPRRGARGAPTPSARRRPRRPRRRPRRSARRRLRAGGRATTIRSIPATSRSASMLHCSSGRPPSSTSAFGRPAPQALAAAGGHDQRDDHRMGRSRTRQLGLPRARKPRYLAPAAAIWWLAESASSSSR